MANLPSVPISAGLSWDMNLFQWFHRTAPCSCVECWNACLRHPINHSTSYSLSSSLLFSKPSYDITILFHSPIHQFTSHFPSPLSLNILMKLLSSTLQYIILTGSRPHSLPQLFIHFTPHHTVLHVTFPYIIFVSPTPWASCSFLSTPLLVDSFHISLLLHTILLDTGSAF